jgi:hypothetical protein
MGEAQQPVQQSQWPPASAGPAPAAQQPLYFAPLARGQQAPGPYVPVAAPAPFGYAAGQDYREPANWTGNPSFTPRAVAEQTAKNDWQQVKTGKGKRSKAAAGGAGGIGLGGVILIRLLLSFGVRSGAHALLDSNSSGRDSRGIDLENPLEINEGECIHPTNLQGEAQVTSHKTLVQPCSPVLLKLSHRHRVSQANLSAAQSGCPGPTFTVHYKLGNDLTVYCFGKP